jgi:hypothetical protein
LSPLLGSSWRWKARQDRRRATPESTPEGVAAPGAPSRLLQPPQHRHAGAARGLPPCSWCTATVGGSGRHRHVIAALMLHEARLPSWPHYCPSDVNQCADLHRVDTAAMPVARASAVPGRGWGWRRRAGWGGWAAAAPPPASAPPAPPSGERE